MKFAYLSIFVIILTGSCSLSDEGAIDRGEGSAFFDEMIAAHGTSGAYQFVFRGNTYTFDEDEFGHFEYTKHVLNDSLNQLDIMTNDGFVRIENGDTLNLKEEEISGYSESLNSVIYFVCLPLKLTDPAVNKFDAGEITIKGEKYHVLRVTFEQEGGGKDFQDVFYYWINQNTHQMDYLAYSYAVNGGGVRFREAFNSRMIGNMRFQDYINYSAPVGTPLDSLPIMFEAGRLEELSLIVTEDVRPLY